MTLRQSNGHVSSTISAFPVVTCSSSTTSSVINAACFDAPKATKKHSLLEQKRRQWAEEKAEKEEWYPFGRPGGGAPLKSPTERMSEQRLRRHSSAASGYSDGGGSNGSVAEFSMNSNLPFHYQTTAENHDTSGGIQHLNLIDPATLPAGYIIGPHGYYLPCPAVPLQCIPAPVAGDPCQSYPTLGAVSSVLVNQPGSAVHPIQHYNVRPVTLPGAIEASTSNSSADQSDVRKHVMASLPMYQQQQLYGYAVANGPNRHQQCHLLTTFAQSPVIAMDSSVASAGRNSLTASTASPPCCNIPTVPHVHPEVYRRAIPHNQNTSAVPSYTEQWADQLQLWQDSEQRSPRGDRPVSLAVPRPHVAVADSKPIQLQMQSPIELPPVSAVNASTPASHGLQPWVMVTPNPPDHHSQQGRRKGDQQRLAVVSPLHSKAPSLSGNETLDGSGNVQFMSASFSGLLPPGSDLRSHHRRGSVSRPKENRESDEKQIKIMEQKLALEEQLEEKRRKQLIEQERERREAERAERERRVIEEKEALENEHERSRWKKLAEQEEKREELIMDSLQHAEVEARRVRREKIFRHASSGRHSESDGYESMSPPGASRSTREQPMQRIQNEEDKDNASVSSPESLDHDSPAPRTKSLPPPSIARSLSIESPGDDRPIRPLTKDPLKIWDEMGYAALGEDVSKFQGQRNAPVRQSMRPSRSRAMARLETIARSASAERQRQSNGHDDAPNCSKNRNNQEKANKTESAVGEAIGDCQKLIGKISNATFIVDSKQADNKKKDPTVNFENKQAKSLLSKDSQNGVDGIATREKESTSEKAIAASETGRKKLLERRPSVEKPILTAPTGDNPWGDTLGGLNPLLQPIVTRRRKTRPPIPTVAIVDESQQILLPDAVISAPTNGKLGSRLDCTVGSSTRKGQSDANNNEKNQIPPANTTNGPVSTVDSVSQKQSRPLYTRAPSLDRFNSKSPLYGSISMKMKRPTDQQNKLLEQIGLLRQQLKKTQKEVEGGLASPTAKSLSPLD